MPTIFRWDLVYAGRSSQRTFQVAPNSEAAFNLHTDRQTDTQHMRRPPQRGQVERAQCNDEYVYSRFLSISIGAAAAAKRATRDPQIRVNEFEPSARRVH